MIGKHIAAFASALVISGALAVFSASARERDSFSEIRNDVELAGGIFKLYDHNVPEMAKAPRGYKPVYISHYGRHGARNTSGRKELLSASEVFLAADSLGLLTETGRECYEKVKRITELVFGHEGGLTGKGVRQQKIISGNMYRNFRPVFCRSARIGAISSDVPRCILTMSAFCTGLRDLNKSLDIRMSADKADIPVTKPSGASLGNYKSDVQDYERGYLEPETVFAPMFRDCSFIGGTDKSIFHEKSLFFLAQSVQCIDTDEDLSLWKYFPEDEICRLWECVSFVFYTSNGPGLISQSDKPWTRAVKTLEDIVSKAETDLRDGEYKARLRFGHDLSVMNMMALLDIDGYNTAVASFNEAGNVWRTFDFPMSLNIQFVFYRNRAGDTLVRLLYNERDIELPVSDCGTRYFYRWEDFRDYAYKRIACAAAIKGKK